MTPQMLRRFIAALGANITTQVIAALIQLASVPIFLSVWSLEKYGQWLLLTAVPSYFALADVGFVAVAINKMTMLASENNWDRVNSVFQTTIKLCIYAMGVAAGLAILIVLPLDLGPLKDWSSKLTLLLLVVCAVLSISSGLFDAVFRACGEYAIGVQLVNGARILEWLGLIGGLLLGGTFVSAACGQLGARTLASLIGWLIASRRHQRLQWGFAKASQNEFRELLRPALSFMAFPIANSISLQGMTLFVGAVYGTSYLVIFNTYRTMARVLVQAVTVVGRSLWPEVTRNYGIRNGVVIRLLYRRCTFASIFLALSLCLALHHFGAKFLQVWTSGRVPFDQPVFDLFLVCAAATSFWQAGMVVLSATNNHLKLSLAYLGASIGAIVLAVSLNSLGIENAPVIALIGFELFLIVVCFLYVRQFFKTFGETNASISLGQS